MMLKPRISFVGQFFILIGLCGAGTVFGGVIALLIWSKMTGLNLIGLDTVTMEKAILNPAYRNATIVFQLIATFFSFFVPAQVFAAIVSKRSMVHLGFNNKGNIRQVLLVITIVVGGLFLVGALGELTKLIPLPAATEAYFKKLELNYMEQIKAFATMRTGTDYILGLLVIAFAPAIFEEVLFRGALQQLFIRWFKHAGIAIVVTSILFSALHFSYYGFFARFALGLVLGYIFYYSKNIWFNILAHCLNNGIAVTSLYLITRAGKPLTDDALDDKFPLWLGVIGLAAVLAAIIIFKKVSEKPAAQTHADDVLLTNDYGNPFNNNNFPEGHNPNV